MTQPEIEPKSPGPQVNKLPFIIREIIINDNLCMCVCVHIYICENM